MNVIARDCWLWHHLDDENPLISNNDQDRLLTMPSHEILEPFGQEWAIYARTTAEELEQERRWLEAQAYWFAKPIRPDTACPRDEPVENWNDPRYRV